MKIICIGRNYIDHAKELNNEVPLEPVIFLKPETAIVPKRNPFFIPDFSNDVHHELELVVRINKIGKHIQEKFAHKYYSQITVGIDFTARDLQKKLKEKGLPWEKAKAFDGSAVVGKWIDLDEKDIQNLNIHLLKNDQVVQQSSTAQMLFSINRLISEVSKYFTLKIGDLLFTGTPAGVGAVVPNDNLRGYINDKELFNINVK
jgi:2-keto-4-pentenoate hydratase/2-oxohepta-3-ene-1,7-dioic acid hydratase in catechol pathway